MCNIVTGGMRPLISQNTAFDLEAAFDDIISNVQSGEYRNEYEFQSDLYLTFSKAKDGHFVSRHPESYNTSANSDPTAVFPRSSHRCYCVSSRESSVGFSQSRRRIGPQNLCTL